MSDSPRVSIIIATYNWSSVLRYAIESVLGQTFRDYELLVIGDGCTDDSAQVVASFADPRIRWHNLPANSGAQSAPNNAGLEIARGHYIAYHGHDDVWHPTHLARLVAAVEAADADLAHAIAVMIGPPESGVRIVTGISRDGHYTPETFLPPSSILHRRDIIPVTGPWRDYRTLNLPPDREFVSRLWAHRQRFACTNELSAFKFNSAWRPNSYREKPCHEQAAYLQRMRTEADFINRELLAIVRAYALGDARSPIALQMPDAPESLPPGWLVEQWRAIRGLPPNALPPAPATRQRPPHRTRRRMRRIFETLARRVGL